LQGYEFKSHAGHRSYLIFFLKGRKFFLKAKKRKEGRKEGRKEERKKEKERKTSISISPTYIYVIE